MTATDAAMNILTDVLRNDPVLSLPNGTGPGQNPAGVKGEVHQGSADTTETFPRSVTYPAIAVVPLSIENVLTMGTGLVAQTNGLVMLKIVTTGGNLTTERLIAERIEAILPSLKRRYWTRGTGQPVYYVSEFAHVRDLPQPNETIGDRIFRFKNLVVRTTGSRRS